MALTGAVGFALGTVLAKRLGTMAVPVIGVVASSVALGEPLGLIQIAALVFTLTGVVLATRS
jgi:drug/metabolite transporter (DMT)-like permease